MRMFSFPETKNSQLSSGLFQNYIVLYLKNSTFDNDL